MHFHKKKFNTKAFISFTTFLSIIILILSGICLYVSPSGGIAKEIKWKLLSLSRDAWRGMHITFCIFFIVFIIFHLIYNLKVLLAYLKNKLTKKLVFKKEFCLALLIVGILLIFSVFQWFPFSKLLEWRDAIKYKPRVHESISLQDSTNPTAIHFSERKPKRSTPLNSGLKPSEISSSLKLQAFFSGCISLLSPPFSIFQSTSISKSV